MFFSDNRELRRDNREKYKKTTIPEEIVVLLVRDQGFEPWTP